MNAFKPTQFLHYDNAISAYIAQQWAMESVAILTENMVAANLVHRDFEDMFARHGDVVNTRKPAEFTARRKGVNDDVTVQDVSATNIPVPLDQHVHTSFLIRDGEETKAFKVLVEEYLRPAVISLARFVDQVVLAQYIQFIANQAGSLGGLTDSNAVSYIANVGTVMDKNKAWTTGRNLIWTPEAQSLIIQNPTFHQADRVGDNGTALRTASIGHKLNFSHFMAQNMSQVLAANSTTNGAINNASGYGVGDTALTVDGFTGVAATVGQWLTINGRVYQVAAKAETTGNTTSITLTYGLKASVADNDVVKLMPKANVDFASGYAAGYQKFILIDDGAGALPGDLQAGQAISFGTDTSNVYTVIEVTEGATETSILLDRPLAVALSDNDTVNYGPQGGGLNFAFHRNAMTLALRPLAPPKPGTGAISGVTNFNGVPIRVVITYDGNKQGHLVTLDFLAGVKVLDTNLGAVVLS